MDAIITSESQLKILMFDCMVELMSDYSATAEMLSGMEAMCEKLLEKLGGI